METRLDGLPGAIVAVVKDLGKALRKSVLLPDERTTINLEDINARTVAGVIIDNIGNISLRGQEGGLPLFTGTVVRNMGHVPQLRTSVREAFPRELAATNSALRDLVEAGALEEAIEDMGGRQVRGFKVVNRTLLRQIFEEDSNLK